MKKSPTVRVKLRRSTFAGSTPDSYQITHINGAIIIGCGSGKLLRVGDTINENEADFLTRSYLVSVTPAK